MAAGNIPFRPPLPVAGIRLGTAAAGIKRADCKDLVLIELAAESECAAVFTRNAFCAAPVIVAREHLRKQKPRYLLINSGNANAGTGQAGVQAALDTCRMVARLADAADTSVMPFSTGVIGQPLPLEKFAAAVPIAFSSLHEGAWADAAHAIMTTDTVPKAISETFEIDGRTVTVSGIAKGAGMIRPDMATMLAYVATDAAVNRKVLQDLLTGAVRRSFNRISVDGDTSTNDACVLIATGRARNSPVTDAYSAPGQALQAALDRVFAFLAEAIVRDGEGATKFIRIRVESGLSEEECSGVAYTIAHSPLVKTAFYASDANWGRILAAIGRAGISNLDIAPITIDLNGVRIVEGGSRAASYTEDAGQAAMRPTDIDVLVDLARGEACAEVWTCDFSFDYVRINAEYRT
ncbi:MAG: Arginine biosynthesis bifunctional protein ArgJ [Gammaproteobacteria bacterium]|nr:Arginine biosynthesis bifunctional protein ArgJ [Gammaproteobacteria bacterium]